MREHNIPWTQLVAQLSRDKLQLAKPCQKLATDFKLTLAELFLIALCGEAEDNYLINIALAQLQAPDENPRPSLHLACSILKDLFGVQLTAGEIANHPLVSKGLLELNGEGPLSMRALSIQPMLWQLFSGRQYEHPGIEYLSEQEGFLIPQQVHQQMPELAELLRKNRIRGIVIRGGEQG